MRKRVVIGLSGFVVLGIAAGIGLYSVSGKAVQSGPVSLPKIDRHPGASSWGRGKLTGLPTFDPNSSNSSRIDLRFADLSELDLRGSCRTLMYAKFDDRTRWPPAERMPTDFDWKSIMEIGKNPSLGIRDLHTRGITGRGVGIAVIDQPLFVEHLEYVRQLRLYEEIHVPCMMRSSWHGPAVASIAVGKTTGVAPEADLYYIATFAFSPLKNFQKTERHFRFYAQAVRRILEINRQLPKNEKIRVISMSAGWDPEEDGCNEIVAAVNEAKAAGMLVVSSNIAETHGRSIQGLGRPPMADPDRFESFEPGWFWAKRFSGNKRFRSTLLIPMDSRSTASSTAPDEYVFFRIGGLSWVTPYLAGVYALAVQVDPAITPDQFLALALKTGRTIELKRDDGIISLGPILDPVTLIEALKSK